MLLSFNEMQGQILLLLCCEMFTLRLFSQRQIWFCSIRTSWDNDTYEIAENHLETTCRCTPVAHSLCLIVSNILGIWRMHHTDTSETTAGLQTCVPRRYVLSSTETCRDWHFYGNGSTVRPDTCLHLFSFTDLYFIDLVSLRGSPSRTQDTVTSIFLTVHRSELSNNYYIIIVVKYCKNSSPRSAYICDFSEIRTPYPCGSSGASRW
jgi:hypothetical protein